jgi:hypothetical protein
MVRRSGVDDVLTPWQFEALFKTAASIKDSQLATEMCALLVIPGRLGSRNAETLHTCEDFLIRGYDGEVLAYQIPTGLECEDSCPVCKELAKQRANDTDDPDVSWQDVIDRYWSPKSHAGGRKIPVLRSRPKELLDLYVEFHGRRPKMSEQTYRNRLLRLEELCDDVDVNLYPQALRATAVNYWAIQGLRPDKLQIKFGWKYLSTAVYYIHKSDRALRVAKQRALGREPNTPYRIQEEPPTLSEVRPNNSSNLIEVEQLTPNRYKNSSESETGANTLEEYAQTRMENMTLSDFNAGITEKSEFRVSPFGIISAYFDAADRIGDWFTAQIRSKWGCTVSEWFERTPLRKTLGTAGIAILTVTVFMLCLAQVGLFDLTTGDVELSPTFLVALIATMSLNIDGTQTV